MSLTLLVHHYIKSYSDRLALRWVKKFISQHKELSESELKTAITESFPGRISNIVFDDSIFPGYFSFLYWTLDQKKAKQELGE